MKSLSLVLYLVTPWTAALSIHGIFQARVLEWGASAFSTDQGSKLYLLQRMCGVLNAGSPGPNWEGGLGAAWGLAPAWFWDGLRLERLLRAQSRGPSGGHNLEAKSSSQTGFPWFRYFLKKIYGRHYLKLERAGVTAWISDLKMWLLRARGPARWE